MCTKELPLLQLQGKYITPESYKHTIIYMRKGLNEALSAVIYNHYLR